jgi:SAM-dependent methyltransferase
MIRQGDWYDFPQYFDLAFRDETPAEVEFFQAAFDRYAHRPVRRVYEPGCGSGRLVVAMADAGYAMTGVDLNQPSLRYLRNKLRRRKLDADLIQADICEYRVDEPVDAAFCTFNTFRQLATESQARGHLQSVAASVATGGIYILGFHILPLDIDPSCTEVWRAKQGRTSVTITLRVLDFNRRKRLEQIRISLLGRTGDKTVRCRTEYAMRLYTAAQVRKLFAALPQWEIAGIHDFDYEIDYPLRLDNELTDAVFVLRRTAHPAD